MALDSRVYRGIVYDTRRPYESTASSPSLRSIEPAHVAQPTAVTEMGEQDSANVKVVVRVRRFLQREIDRGARCIIKMNACTQATTLLPPDDADPGNAQTRSRKILDEKEFTFDKSFCSFDESHPDYASQEDVYRSFGEEFLDHNFNGFHTCIFAYGQTGSGKSYTMMGTQEQPGLIPRTCEAMFARMESEKGQNTTYSVHVSYFEVYNEHVRDLLTPRVDPPSYLKIRESQSDGVYVQNLKEETVKSFEDIQQCLRAGDLNRTTAATKMNDTSSRSHAVFTVHLKITHIDPNSSDTVERSSRMRLVDLAGSERPKATGAAGQRLIEGGKINKSLSTLGRVIAALADPRRQDRPGTPSGGRGTPNGTPKRKSAAKLEVVPYRDSVLTWLLKDSLGGNSKTAMVACISPSDYDETLSTLRYADQAKKIRTRAHTNLNTVSAAQRDAQIVSMTATIAQLQAQINSQAQRNRERELKDAKQREKREREEKEEGEALADYQKQVEKMQRLMEEGKAVSETRIRALNAEVEELREVVPSLQAENENLRRHLGLVLGELRNPIVLPLPAEDVEDIHLENVPDEVAIHDFEDQKHINDVDFDSGDETAVEDHHVQWARDTQAEIETYLKELGVLRRKIGDDHERFGMVAAPNTAIAMR